MNKFEPYMKWLRNVSAHLGRDIKPSALTRELYELDADPEDAATDYGRFL
ncbi:hypothetical protein RCIP0008_00235 [Klebsiella phage RCIP0008]